jgi:hypothetical protein
MLEANFAKSKHLILLIGTTLPLSLSASPFVFSSVALGSLCTTSVSAEEKDSNAKAADQRRKEFLDRVEKMRRDSQERAAKMEAERPLRYARAQEEYEKAKQKKNTDKPAYVHALIKFAIACRESRDLEKASRLYDEAFDTYLTIPKGSNDEELCRREVWKHLDYLSAGVFPKKFAQLFKISEQRDANWQGLNNDVANALRTYRSRSRSYLGSGDEESQIELDCWKTAIDIRSSIRGENDPSLADFYREYGNACEQNKDLDGAEKAFLRAQALNPDKSPDGLACSQIRIAHYYLQRNMNDKAAEYLNKAEKTAGKQMSRNFVSQLQALSDEYIRRSHPADAEKITTYLLEIGGDEVLQEVDRSLSQIIEGYINSFDFTKAQSLLLKRIEATKTCSNDHSAARWRLKLSDVDLAMGQDAESNKLFDQVKTNTALLGGDVDKLIANRAKLIETLKKNKSR